MDRQLVAAVSAVTQEPARLFEEAQIVRDALQAQAELLRAEPGEAAEATANLADMWAWRLQVAQDDLGEALEKQAEEGAQTTAQPVAGGLLGSLSLWANPYVWIAIMTLLVVLVGGWKLAQIIDSLTGTRTLERIRFPRGGWLSSIGSTATWSVAALAGGAALGWIANETLYE